MGDQREPRRKRLLKELAELSTTPGALDRESNDCGWCGGLNAEGVNDLKRELARVREERDEARMKKWAELGEQVDRADQAEALAARYRESLEFYTGQRWPDPPVLDKPEEQS